MTLIIGDFKYSKKIKQVHAKSFVKRVGTLPRIKMAQDQQIFPDPDKTLICLQREYAYYTVGDPHINFRYMGSLNVHKCIVVCFETLIDRAIVHLGHAYSEFKFMPMIDQFKMKNDRIIVTIIGGVANSISQKILEYVIIELSYVAVELSIDIEISQQCILKHNIFRDKYLFIFDKIFEKADYVSRCFFNTPLNKSILDGRKPSDLKSISLTQNIKQNQRLLMFIALLSQITIVGRTNSTVSLVMRLLGKLTYEEFTELFVKSYSIQGFNLLDPGYEINKLYSDVDMVDFVLDTISGEFHKISRHQSTPFKYQRMIAPLDKFTTHQCCFDLNTRTFKEQSLSQSFLNLCDKVDPSSATKERVFSVLREINAPLTIPLMNALMLFIISKDYNSPVIKPHIERADIDSKDFYERKLQYETTTLRILRKYIHSGFEGHARIQPESVVDGLIQINESDKYRITAKLKEGCIKYYEINVDGKDCLLIPAVNCGEYAKNISVLVNKLPLLKTNAASLTYFGNKQTATFQRVHSDGNQDSEHSVQCERDTFSVHPM